MNGVVLVVLENLSNTEEIIHNLDLLKELRENFNNA